MNDISMCCARSCPVSAACKRHADSGTKPDIWQSYAGFQPTSKDGCDAYWHQPKKETK